MCARRVHTRILNFTDKRQETNMIKVFEAFAGYGSQSMALRRLGIGFEVVGISEIDKYAIQAYMAVHGDTPNYGDSLLHLQENVCR